MAKSVKFESGYLPMEFLEQVAEVIRLLGHPSRLSIVDVLDREGEITAGTVSELCGMTQSQTSQHLAQMRRLGIVSSRREGTLIITSSTATSRAPSLGAFATDIMSLAVHLPKN
jgi:Predicted transcriptional regulators